MKIRDDTTALRCNLCGGYELIERVEITKPDRFEAYVLSKYDDAISYSSRRWLTCKGCHVAMQVIPQAMRVGLGEIADNYYEIDFGDIDLRLHQQKILSLPHAASDNANRVVRVVDIIEKYRPRWTKPFARLKAMDFGSGLGVFPIVLSNILRSKAINLDMHLIETDKRALELLREVSMTLHEGLYEPKNHNGYHTIFINKVLEHLSDPVGWILTLKQALILGGLLYVEVPSTRSLELDPSSAALGSLHFNLFGPKALETLGYLTSLVLLGSEDIDEPSGKRTCYGVFTNSD